MAREVRVRARKGCVIETRCGLLAVWLLGTAAMGGTTTGGAEPVSRQRSFAAGLVYSRGSAGFDEGMGFWRSKLEFPLDGWLVELRGSVRRPTAWGRQPAFFTLSGRYSGSVDVSGRSYDYDWDAAGRLSDYSYSDSTADVRIWDVKAGWSTVFDRLAWAQRAEAGLSIGYGAEWYDFADRNLYAVYDYGATQYALQGPTATYEIEFRGMRVGGFTEIRPGGPLALRVDVEWIPVLRAESEALWILRDYPFWQAADGQGIILAVRGDWALSETLSLFSGLRTVRLIADRNGVESGVLNGWRYDNEPIVSELTSVYYGIEAGVEWRF